MLTTKIKSGTRAIAKKDIGKLPAGTIAKVILHDESKTTIELVFNGYPQKFYLESGKFKNDFELMKNFLESGETEVTLLQDKTNSLSSTPHSKKNLYTSVL
jgi:hypothetical protein